MAGDWIKFRTELCRSPKVLRVAVNLKLPKATILGALLILWSLADEQTTNGTLRGMTFEALDQEVGVSGFCRALADPAVDWAKETDKGVTLPRWGEHNGKTAKTRAQTARRVAKSKGKNGNAEVTHPALPERYLEQEQSRAAESREELLENQAKQHPSKSGGGVEHEPPMLRSDSQKALCSLLLAADLGLSRNEAAGIAQEPRASRERILWALDRLAEQRGKAAAGKAEPVKNPAGWVRGLVQCDDGPPAGWRKKNLRRILAAEGAKDAIGAVGTGATNG